MQQMRHIRATTVAVAEQYYIFWVRISSLSYPACKVHALYYFVTCGLSGCTIFFAHYLI